MNTILKKSHVFVAVVIILLIGFFHGKSIPTYPAYTHTWANMDRMALARGFERNNLNFFQPQNYLLNHQYPDFWYTASESNRTAVEFPIHDYVPAVFMKLTGNNGPVIFHLYILLMSFLGLFYLYRLSFRMTKSFWKSSFVVAFAALSPVYVFYQGGFLPTIPCITLTIIALYQYSRYYATQDRKYWFWMLFFITLTVLSRSTYAIPFLAILGFEFVRILRKKSRLFPILWATLLSFVLIALSLYYNATVRKTYGSDFLSELLPAKSWSDLKWMANHMYEMWRYAYFTHKHYWALGIILLLVGIGMVLKRKRPVSVYSQFWGLLLIWLLGVGLFWVLMNQQFAAHDYYFLDTFFLPILFMLILLLNALPSFGFAWSPWLFRLFTVVFIVYAFNETKKFQEERKTFGAYDKFSGTLFNFLGSETWLDALHVPKNAKILVLDASAPNVPFVLMNRIGYAAKEMQDPEQFQHALNYHWDYLVLQKTYFEEDIYNKFPQILNLVRPIAYNENLILCKRKMDTIPQNLIEFIGFNHKIVTYRLDSKQINKGVFSDVTLVPSPTDKLRRVVAVREDQQYSLNGNFTKSYQPKQANGVLVKAHVLANPNKKGALVFVITKKGETPFYKTIEIAANASGYNKWGKNEWFFVVPKMDIPDVEFGCYLFNPEKNRIYIDSLEVTLFNNTLKK